MHKKKLYNNKTLHVSRLCDKLKFCFRSMTISFKPLMMQQREKTKIIRKWPEDRRLSPSQYKFCKKKFTDDNFFILYPKLWEKYFCPITFDRWYVSPTN